ncbi:MAG: UvrB/UvrC motif-containing protein [Treponema sp.]|nr:UvrB/UvrC motif-containing protein [Treponema sp.]
MLCDICGKREAIVFIHQVGAGGQTELHLCSQCAYEHGLQNLEGDIGKALSDLLKKLPLDKVPASGLSPLGKTKKKYPEQCPFCGLSLPDLKKQGLAGCETCWNVFGDLLVVPHVKKQGPQQHRGRFSLQVSDAIAQKQELEQLKNLLQAAVDREDYEQAAMYRDRIRILEMGAARRG